MNKEEQKAWEELVRYADCLQFDPTNRAILAKDAECKRLEKVVAAAKRRQSLLEYLVLPWYYSKEKWMDLGVTEEELRAALDEARKEG